MLGGGGAVRGRRWRGEGSRTPGNSSPKSLVSHCRGPGPLRPSPSHPGCWPAGVQVAAGALVVVGLETAAAGRMT